MAGYDGSIRINTKINTKDVPSQLQKLENSMQKVADKVVSLRQKMESLKDAKIPTDEYKEIQNQIEVTEKKINNLMARQERFLATGGKESSSAFKKMQYDLDELNNSLPYLQGELQDLVNTGKAFTLGSDTEEHSNLAQKLKEAENELLVLKKRYEELLARQGSVSDRFSKMKDSAKKAFSAMSSDAKQADISLSKGLKTILKYGFGIRSIYALFNKVRAGITAGFTNLMNYSDGFANSVQGVKNSMSTLGNQIAAAFSPIVQLVLPWLSKLIDAISTAMTYVAQFIAVLGGKSTFTRAKKVQDSYNKSLDNTAKAADKARGALAKFDDLDVLEKKEENVDAGGGVAGAAGDLFEEVPVDSKFKDWLDGILEKLKPILDYFNKLKDIFMEGFWDGLGDWEYRLESIKNSLASIKDSVIDIFTDPAVITAADNWAQSVAYMLGALAGSMSSVGLTIATNLVGGIALYLEQNKERIKSYLISMFDIWADVNNMLSVFFISFAYVFEAFASESGQQLTANLIGIFTDAFMGVTELASKLARDLLNTIIKPFVDNKEEFRTALEGFLGVLEEVTRTIKQGIDDTFDKLNEVYDEHFKPFFDSVSEGLSELTNDFLEFWNGNVQPILDKWAEDFDKLWKEHIQPLLDNAAEFLGKVADLLKVLWENVLQPFIEWIISNVLSKILPVIDSIWNTLVEFVGYVADFVNDFITLLGGIIDFLTGIFSSDFDLAYKGLAEIASGFVDMLKDLLLGGITLIFNGIVTKILEFTAPLSEAGQEIVQGIVDGILSFKDKVVNAVTDIADSIVGWFKDALGIHSPSTVMEEQGEYITEGLLDGMKDKIYLVSELWNNLKQDMINTLKDIGTWFLDFWSGLLTSISTKLQNIKKSFSETWTNIQKSTAEVWNAISEFFTKTLSDIQKFFTDIWTDIQNWFTGFWNRFTAYLREVWENITSYLIRKLDEIGTFFRQKLEDIRTFFTNFMSSISNLVSTVWNSAWTSAQNIFESFKARIESVAETIRNIIGSLFSWISDSVSGILSAISEVGDAASTTSSQVGSLMGSVANMGRAYTVENISAYNLDSIPQLASGAVIRGGNPFMAILGDQPRGQVNIEAPLATIEQGVENVLSRNGYGNVPSGLNPTISLNVNGQEFARLTLGDILHELGRQGYNVDVLGVT
ncbi:MAG: hypothetical protein NC321_16100 [Clostridium sp.]|nr:hypothetical protein [Lachnospiraceae bacterium]MCM1254341.1 hypothetical protein [Clostridium sp.]